MDSLEDEDERSHSANDFTVEELGAIKKASIKNNRYNPFTRSPLSLTHFRMSN